MKAIEKLGIVASKKDDEFEPSLGEEVTRVELQDDSAVLTHEGLQLITDHVFIEFRNVELFIPLLVELLCRDPFSKLDVSEAFKLVVFWQLTLEQGAERGLAHSGGARDENVRQFAWRVCLFHHSIYR